MPAASSLLAPADYRALRDDLREILTRAEEEARQVASRLAARAYWRVGKRLLEARLAQRAGYRAQVIADLAQDLGIGERLLREAEAFARAYPTHPADAHLGWSHYRELLRLQDPARRAYYAALATEEKLTVRALRAAIRSRAYEDGHPSANEDDATRAALPRPTDPAYIYRAHVDRVIDGDTLDLIVDLGFDVLKRHRIRLAAIDAPPRNTAEGKAATRYLTELLTDAGTLVVQTRKYDLHGRYVAHLFCAPTGSIGEVFAHGNYVNGQMLTQGHAAVYKG